MIEGEDLNEEVVKEYALQKLCQGWKTYKRKLWDSAKGDDTKTIDELINSMPTGVQDPENWAQFVKHKRSAEGRVSKF